LLPKSGRAVSYKRSLAGCLSAPLVVWAIASPCCCSSNSAFLPEKILPEKSFVKYFRLVDFMNPYPSTFNPMVSGGHYAWR
jgi:hypothetical protein